jgi:hypothetical protein
MAPLADEDLGARLGATGAEDRAAEGHGPAGGDPPPPAGAVCALPPRDALMTIDPVAPDRARLDRQSLSPEAFRRAAAEVRAGRWVQRAFLDYPTGARCATGYCSVFIPGGDRFTDWPMLEVLMEAVGVVSDLGIILWNDRRHQTAEAVARAFDRAAVLQEQWLTGGVGGDDPAARRPRGK